MLIGQCVIFLHAHSTSSLPKLNLLQIDLCVFILYLVQYMNDHGSQITE